MGEINDRRTEAQKAETVGFVLATDNFMSGWGHAPGRSIFAVPFHSSHDVSVILDNFAHRSEMKRVRVVYRLTKRERLPRVRLGDSDHLSIATWGGSSGFYTAGWFAMLEADRRRRNSAQSSAI